MSLERTDIARAIDATKSETHPDGNVTIAARSLGASRRTLQNRMRAYHMPRGRAGRPKKRLRRRAQIARVVSIGAVVALGAVVLLRGSRVA